MAEVAAHVTDNVLPHLPVRQWVLSLPKRLRPFLHYDPDIAGAVLRIFLRAVLTTLCHASPGAPRDAQLGRSPNSSRHPASTGTGTTACSHGAPAEGGSPDFAQPS